MAISHNRNSGSNGVSAAFDPQTAMERSLALTLSPFRQGLRFYSEFQRSALDAFSRVTSATLAPVMTNAARTPKEAAKPAAKPAATKRPTATKAAAAKAAPKRTVKKAAGAKPAAKVAKKTASTPSRPRRTRVGTAKKG